MIKDKFIPDIGDIVWVDFNPQYGHEQANKRPALVLTGQKYNKKNKLCVVCPVTSRKKRIGLDIPLTGGKTKGVVLTNQIRTIDWQARRVKFYEKAKNQDLKAVQDIVRSFLEL